MSLEEISVRTRISLRNLQAIEDDDISVMPSAFFYKSFVGQFANELHIESNTLFPLIESVLAQIPEPLVPGQDERIAKNAVVRRSSRRGNFKWLFSLASLLLVLICCSGFYAFWENNKGGVSRNAADDSTRSTRSPSSQSGLRKQGSQATGPADGFRVELSALEPTWLSITADGKQTFSGTLETEQTKRVDGHERTRIRTGNAGGISFVFNGNPIGVVGPRGQTRTIVFTRNNYEVLEPSAGVSLTSVIPIFEWMKPLRASLP